MQTIKKITGVVMMLLAPAILFFLIYGAWTNIHPAGKEDINKPVPWIIIITVFAPIVTGLFVFGYYAFSGAYEDPQ